MSVQLIVYPQNYNGQFNAYSSYPIDFLVNGLFFTGLNSTPIFSSASSIANLPLDIMNLAPPTIPNTWYRFISTGVGTAPTPVVTSANLVLESSAAATATFAGVYQRLTNTNIGQTYKITINLTSIPTPVNGFIHIRIYDGVTQSAFTIITPNALQLTYDFQAPNTNFTIILGYSNTGYTNTVTIDNLIVRPMATSPSFSNFELEDGQVICDLYEDEDIPLSLSVDNFKNVAEKVQSYSKAFKLPATKRNNRIFDNMFELTRADDGVIFNPYNKTQCILKQDGFILFEGYLKMIDISDKDGEISYNVNLYSEVVALADILKDRTFSDLDFSELDHLYNYTVIKSSWDGNLTLLNALPSGSYAGTGTTTDVLKYPFVDWNHQYSQDANGPVLNNLETSFRPFIQLKYLINRIFAETPFTWESNFFNSAEFEGLFMDFNWGSDDTPNDFSDNGVAQYKTGSADNFATTAWTDVEFTDFNSMPDEIGFDGTSVFTCPAGQQNSTFVINANVRVRNVLNNADIQFRWLKNTSTVLNLSPVMSTTGMAAIWFKDFNSALLSTVTVDHGGFYASQPTLTLSGASLTANGTFPGPITSVTINNWGSSVLFWDEILINGLSQSNSQALYNGFVNTTVKTTISGFS